MNEETFVCSVCGCVLPSEVPHEFDGQLLCEKCLDRQTTICTCCNERIWSTDNSGESDCPLCGNCFDRYYIRCESCRCIIHRDEAHYPEYNDEPYCDSCYDNHNDYSVIHDYGYKPDPIFYGDENRFYGVELEIDRAGEDCYNAQQILDIANKNNEYIYCKHDGSLDDGFEIVTHPMTLKYHQESMPWQEITERAINMGYTSHQAKTCGLHIHVNRNAFGDTEGQQEVVIARILYFFEKNWEELLKFSRRTEYQLQRWAARYGYKEQPKDILDHAKKGYGGGRYTCVNITNYNTIEIRMFRGTLKYNTIIATLQMIDKICNVALSLSDEEIKGLSWTSFADSIDKEKYPELITYLKERRLYINDACESTEEI